MYLRHFITCTDIPPAHSEQRSPLMKSLQILVQEGHNNKRVYTLADAAVVLLNRKASHKLFFIMQKMKMWKKLEQSYKHDNQQAQMQRVNLFKHLRSNKENKSLSFSAFYILFNGKIQFNLYKHNPPNATELLKKHIINFLRTFNQALT